MQVKAQEWKETLLQSFAKYSYKEHEILRMKFDSSLQFVHVLLGSGWIAFAIGWRKYW